MGIRSRLLLLVMGATVPLILVGLVALRREWTESRQQLDESVEQQAQLASVTLARWFDAQKQPLAMLAAAEESRLLASQQGAFGLMLAARPHWLDVRVMNASGAQLASAPPDAKSLQPYLAESLMREVAERRTAVINTDWTSEGERRVLVVASPLASGHAVVVRLDASSMEEPLRDLKLPQRALLTVLDPQQRVVFRSRSPELYVGNPVNGSVLLSALADSSSAVAEVESPVDGTRRIYGLARVGNTGFLATVGYPTTTLYEPARRKLLDFGLLTLAALLCSVAAALLLARGISAPLRRLSVEAESLGAGDFSAHATTREGVSEIAKLSAAFDRMVGQIVSREERLKELDRLKSEFVSSVSHELRTPLTTIKTLTRIMLGGGSDEATRRRYLETIASQCDRQIDLVHNLLDVSRIESGALSLQPERVDAGEVVRACLKSQHALAELHDHRLEAMTPLGLPPVCADPGALRRALCTVVENAIKYVPDGGRIMLTARDAGGHVEISVSDTGRGIAPEDIPYLFEKFYRGRRPETSDAGSPGETVRDDHAEAPGVGLGLYLVRNLLEQMGGSITVESEPGRGSTFTLSLPKWEGEACDRSETEVAYGAQAIARR